MSIEIKLNGSRLFWLRVYRRMPRIYLTTKTREYSVLFYRTVSGRPLTVTSRSINHA